jgi:hypothetical protein
MRINLRYLQNTLEQLVLFMPGVLGLAVYCSDGGSMRAVAATTVVWIAARIAFWILLCALPRLAAGEPVTTVAIDLGYENPAAFTLTFRRAQSPGDGSATSWGASL